MASISIPYPTLLPSYPFLPSPQLSWPSAKGSLALSLSPNSRTDQRGPLSPHPHFTCSGLPSRKSHPTGSSSHRSAVIYQTKQPLTFSRRNSLGLRLLSSPLTRRHLARAIRHLIHRHIRELKFSHWSNEVVCLTHARVSQASEHQMTKCISPHLDPSESLLTALFAVTGKPVGSPNASSSPNQISTVHRAPIKPTLSKWEASKVP